MSANVAPVYRGRFAPSPTGPLHFGSLATAVASYLQARKSGGEWLVRIEDIDPPREVAGAGDAILRSLDAHGFEYPAPLFQSQRLEQYDAVVSALIEHGDAYPCSCTRQTLQTDAKQGRVGLVYPGTCRNGADESERQAVSVRVRSSDEILRFTDLLQGEQSCRLKQEIGDFLIRRGDGLIAYQLAVVVDDNYQGITDVVRGTDLLDATFMQLWLQRLLHYTVPRYMHTPVVTGPDGRKLSKQTGAREIDPRNAAANLFQVFEFLGHNPDKRLKSAPIKELWAWGQEHWQPELLRGRIYRPDSIRTGV